MTLDVSSKAYAGAVQNIAAQNIETEGKKELSNTDIIQTISKVASNNNIALRNDLLQTLNTLNEEGLIKFDTKKQ